MSNIEDLIGELTIDEQAELDQLLAEDTPLWSPLPGPQSMAYNSEADIIGYGGAAGGGKTDLIAGLSCTKHKRVLVVRREKAQTEGFVQRMAEIMGDTGGLNSQKATWRLPKGTNALLEFGGLDNPGDERRWQGRPHDLKAFDEATEQRESQVRFIMGWTRTSDESIKTKVLMTFNPPTTAEGRWVIKFFAPWLDRKHPKPAAPGELRWFTTKGDDQDFEVPDGRSFVFGEKGELVYDFNPDEHKPEDIITPKSRTFIPARVTDNLYYMKSGYMSQLQALPEPLRSQMLYGDFSAGVKDDPWQVCPTAWVEAAMARWVKPAKRTEMHSLGIDVARGGADNTIIARRHEDMWFDEALVYPGTETPNGPATAGLCLAAMRDAAPMHIDVIGVGASPYDFLVQAKQQILGVNVSEKATGTDKSGRLKFKNLRSQLWWMMREALDPSNDTGIALPPDRQLLADLCAPKWELQGSIIYVEGREDILKRIGRSPDWASAYILALIDTPKMHLITKNQQRNHAMHYSPLEVMSSFHNGAARDYDPLSLGR